MTTKQWHFFDEKTGLFVGRTFTGETAFLPHNTPDGLIPVPDVDDPHSQRYDLDAKTLVDYQPPQPSGMHEWNHVTKRWNLTHAELARQHLASEMRMRSYALKDQLPELTADVALGKDGALDKLRAVDSELTLLRSQLEHNPVPNV